MPTVLLVRHGRSTANARGVLAGWMPGVPLDDAGRRQSHALGRRLATLPLAAIVTSPLQRCRETAALLTDATPDDGLDAGDGARAARPAIQVDHRLGECRYGDWTGRTLKELSRDPLWRTVQAHPSAVTFPGRHGESILAMQLRAVAAIREHDARLAGEHGDDSLWLAVSHADVIKAVLADALGMHLDSFQRIVIDPCSVSVVRYTPLRPFAVRLNDTGGELTGLRPRARRSRRPARPTRSDAVVGGTTGLT